MEAGGVYRGNWNTEKNIKRGLNLGLEEVDDRFEKTLADINKMNSNRVFDNYITKLAFPFFKNFTFHSEINFQFPLTILTGKNGSGKSSALHALYGSPKGKNISDYWFSSQLDPIEDFGGEVRERHCFFYEYYYNGENSSVLYQRNHHKNRNSMEYWETSRPRAKYRMNTNQKRSNPIEKELVYIDFRKELSAFDKFFYFGNIDHLKSNSKQDYLRLKSVELKNVIDSGEIHEIRGCPQNESSIQLTEPEIMAIGSILQENYKDIKLIDHKLFQGWGTSVIWSKDGFTYSEAHAGSGEIAVVILVHKVLNAQPKSLILLDEPEVSLHPGAQKLLLLFLLEQVKTKKHQVIMSTHSPAFAEGMPKEAIKRFIRNPDTNKIDILDECFPSEAFKYLGLSSKYDNAKIHVEDELAQKIIFSVIKNNSDRFDNLNVFFTPGGASYMKQNYILHYAHEDNNKNFVLFDGDQSYDGSIVDLNTLTVKDFHNKDYLKEQIKSFTGQEINFVKDGGNGKSRDDQIIEAQKKYINYYKSCVKFLPKTTPEEIIWDENYVSEILLIKDKTSFKEVMEESDYKIKILKTAMVLTGNDNPSSIRFIEDMLIKKWIETNDESQVEIKEILLGFMKIINNQEMVMG
ncbi:ATP-dependent nuclease [Paenibacillus monticola]|uniref:AAA family ATPase n=1 Tax=Paenibacillus monticola TaxID=2666075 RepID=A0A7X2H8A0_9BACL|nr:AAA family ATPase [Paenibacillus monticola]MRN55250.1 AAA family ATPase [Paenibacillus monticola]